MSDSSIYDWLQVGADVECITNIYLYNVIHSVILSKSMFTSSVQEF